MIAFWVTRDGDHGVENLRSRLPPEMAARVSVTHYEDLDPRLTTHARAHVFSALDQLTPAQEDAVELIQAGLEAAQPGVRLLNHPRRTLRRFELLDSLHRAGLNRFRAFRVSDGWEEAAYPVFVREATGHNGAQTRLLSTPRDVHRAVVSLVARGFRRADLLVVEYCDTSDTQGCFRKYGALMLGGHILPRHMLVGTDWMLKSSANDPDARTAEEELAYVRDNPHAACLRDVCATAGVDYGRIDYSVIDGSPQVWEINLNPTLGAGRGGRTRWPPDIARFRDERRRVGMAAMLAALEDLDDGPEPPEVTVELPATLVARIVREGGTRVRRARRLALAHRMYEHPVLGWPARWLYGRVLARH